MKSRQKKALIVGAALVALMLLFPPWDYFDPDTSGRSSAGYHFFLSPPDSKGATFRYQVRFPNLVRLKMNDIRLVLQLLITIPTTIGLAFIFGSNRSIVSTILGVIFLLCGAAVAGFVIWIVVSEGLEDGVWALP